MGLYFPAHVVVDRHNPKAERAHARKVTLYAVAWIELNILAFCVRLALAANSNHYQQKQMV